MTPPRTDLDLDERREMHRRHDDPSQPSLTKIFGVALGVVSLAGSVFTAGYNWRSVAVIEANQENFVRKDVQDQQLRNVNDRLTEISRQLEEMRNEARTRRKE